MISLLLILSACFYDETEDNTLYTSFLYLDDLQTGLDYGWTPCGTYNGQVAFCGYACESEEQRLCKKDSWSGCLNDSTPSWYSPQPFSDDFPAACPDYDGGCRQWDLCSEHEEQCIESYSKCFEDE